MNEATAKKIDDAASRIIDLVNDARRNVASTGAGKFSPVSADTLASLLSLATSITGTTRPVLRSGIEQLALAANGPMERTGVVESLDVHDVRHVQVEVGTTPGGHNVLYVHGDGVTRLRLSRFESLQIRDDRRNRTESVQPGSGDPKTDPEPFDESTGPNGPMSPRS